MAEAKKERLTANEEAFCQEVAINMFGTPLESLGVDVRHNHYLYTAYKAAYPNSNASSTASLQVLASRLYKKVKIRLRIKELAEFYKSKIQEATVESVKSKLNEILSLSPSDFYIIDAKTGMVRRRKENELSNPAWWLVKRISRYGYEKLTITEIVDVVAKLNGYYKQLEAINASLTIAPKPEDIIYKWAKDME